MNEQNGTFKNEMEHSETMNEQNKSFMNYNVHEGLTIEMECSYTMNE